MNKKRVLLAAAALMAVSFLGTVLLLNMLSPKSPAPLSADTAQSGESALRAPVEPEKSGPDKSAEFAMRQKIDERTGPAAGEPEAVPQPSEPGRAAQADGAAPVGPVGPVEKAEPPKPAPAVKTAVESKPVPAAPAKPAPVAPPKAVAKAAPSAPSAKATSKPHGPVKPAEVKAADAGAARLLKAVEASGSDGKVTVNLRTGGSVGEYKCFAMSSPSRLVLDLMGAWTFSGNDEIGVKGGLAKKIRIGHHPDRLRLVLDLNEGSRTAPVVAKTSDGLSWTVKKAP